MSMNLTISQYVSLIKMMGYANGHYIDQTALYRNMELVYARYKVTETSKLFGGMFHTPESDVFIFPSREKDKWMIIDTERGAHKTINEPIIFSTKEEALRYCYEQYMMEKLSGREVLWRGPDLKEFWQEEN